MYISLIMVVFSPFFAALPMAYLVRYLGSQGKCWFRNPWSTGLFLLFLWSVIAGAVNMQLVSILASAALFGYYLVSIYLQECYRCEENVERLFFILYLLTIVSAFCGVLENFAVISHYPTWWKCLLGLTTVVVNEENFSRITGTFGNPNLAASWYAVMVLVGFYFSERTRGMRQLLLTGGVILFICVLIMTESRGAMIGLFFGLVVYDFFAGQKRQMLVRLVLLAAGLALMLHYPEWFPRGDLLFSTINLRQAIWENCFNMVLIKPVTGWGLMGIYFADSNVYQYLRVLHAHNALLSIATMLGLVGLGIFAWMEWGVLKALWQLFQRQYRLVSLFSGIQAIFIAHGIFDFTIMGLQVGLLFFGSSALISG